MQFANGDRYEGEFVRGKLVGTGTVTWRSGLDPRQLEELLMSRTEGADNLDLPEQARTRPVMKMVRECQPKYPEFAARTEASGVTQVSYLVGKTGKVSKVRVDRSSGDTPAHKLLDFSTTVAVWTCPIEPGKINGQPAEMWATVEYVWTLD
jgi:protein TonB